MRRRRPHRLRRRSGRSMRSSPRAARTSTTTWPSSMRSAQELAFGHAKHPPLVPAVVAAWFTVFPVADWAYYLLAVTTAALALWIAWRLSERYLDGEKRVVGLALLTLVPFFNFHALKFNQNTVLLPLWAATTLFFLRSFETRKHGGCGARRRAGGGRDLRQVLVGHAAPRARHRGADRSPSRRLFPLARALGDDRGRRAGARPARRLAGRATTSCRSPMRSPPTARPRWRRSHSAR